MKPRYFEDFAVGERVRTSSVTLTEAQIIDYAMRYDPQDIHVDTVAAEKGFYKGLIASGWHVGAVAFRLFVQTGFLHGGSMGSPGVDSTRWHRPVRPGDTILLDVEVKDSRLSSKRDRGYLTLDYQVKNQRDEVVMTWTGVQIVALRPTG